MIHIDVKRQAMQHGADPIAYLVQTSTDGAGWRTQYVHTLQVGQNVEDLKRDAEETARVFANGCRYAGADVRMTSGGYAL